MSETPDTPEFDTWEECARYWAYMHEHEMIYRQAYEKALTEIQTFVKRWPPAVHFSRIRKICDTALNFSDVTDVNPGQPDANAGLAGDEEE